MTNDSAANATSNYGLFSVTNDVTGASVQWTPLTPFVSWRYANFGNDWNDPAIGGSLADPDHDGIPNILEYVFNTSPLSFSPAGLSLPTVTPGGALQAFYTRRKAATSELSIVAEYAETPAGSWDATNVTQEVISDDGTVQSVRVAKPLDAGALRGFLRLHVTGP